jgi:hypothetical protein
LRFFLDPAEYAPMSGFFSGYRPKNLTSAGLVEPNLLYGEETFYASRGLLLCRRNPRHRKGSMGLRIAPNQGPLRTGSSNFYSPISCNSRKAVRVMCTVHCTKCGDEVGRVISSSISLHPCAFTHCHHCSKKEGEGRRSPSGEVGGNHGEGNARINGGLAPPRSAHLMRCEAA